MFSVASSRFRNLYSQLYSQQCKFRTIPNNQKCSDNLPGKVVTENIFYRQSILKTCISKEAYCTTIAKLLFFFCLKFFLSNF